MDTTPEYIRMCEKAWPDLKRKCRLGDCLYFPQFRDIGLITYDKDAPLYSVASITEGRLRGFGNELEWWILWQQDQLQEMINITPATFSNILSSIQYVRNKPPQSFEVMWLEIGMQKKNSKTWNDEKEGWEKIKEGRK